MLMSSKTADFRHFLSLSLKRFFPVFLLGVSFMVTASKPASAQSLYWDPSITGSATGSGGNGTWNGLATNWSTGSTDQLWVQGDSAIFGGAAGTVSVSLTQSVAGISFAQTTGNYNLTAGILAFTAGGTNSLGENTITYGSASTISFTNYITAQVTGTNGLYFGPTTGTVGGTSQQVNFYLSGNNTGLSGTTATVDNSAFVGTIFLALDNNNALGSITNLNLVGGGGTTYSAGPPVVKYGSPQLYLGSNSGSVTVTTDLTFNFNLNFSGTSAGVVYGGLTSHNATLNGNITFGNLGGSFRDSTPNTTTYLNGGTLTNSNATTTTNTNFAFATGNGVNTSAISISDLIANNPNNANDKLGITIQATGNGNGSAGTVYLTNTANTYTAPTVINQGTLNVASLANGGSASSIGASSNAASNLILFGTTAVITSGINYSGELQYTGSTAQSTDRLFQIGNNGANGSTNTYNNAVIDASGSTSTATVSFTNPGVLTYGATTTATGNNSILVLTGTNTGLNSFAPGINDPGTLSGVVYSTQLFKEGAGTWELTNANSYSGGTTIKAGTLLAANSSSSGSATGTGAVSVNSTGTLGGTGFVGGATTVNSGGGLAPGLAPGTTGLLTFKSSLTLNSGSTATFDVNGAGTAGTNYDSVAVTGALAYSGTLTLNLTANAGTTNYNLFTFGSYSNDLTGITLSGLYSGSLTDASGVWTGTAIDTADSSSTNFTFTDSTGILNTVTTVPEPSVIWLMLGGLGLLGFVRRLRRNTLG